MTNDNQRIPLHVRGVSRALPALVPQTLWVFFSRELTDDELRHFHDTIRDIEWKLPGN